MHYELTVCVVWAPVCVVSGPRRGAHPLPGLDARALPVCSSEPVHTRRILLTVSASSSTCQSLTASHAPHARLSFLCLPHTRCILPTLAASSSPATHSPPRPPHDHRYVKLDLLADNAPVIHYKKLRKEQAAAAGGAAAAGDAAAALGLAAAGVPPIAAGSLAHARMGGGNPAPEPGAGRGVTDIARHVIDTRSSV